MLLTIIILAIVLILVLVRSLLVRRELRALDQQLRFKLDYKSQAELGLQFSNKDIRALRSTFQIILTKQEEERKKRHQSEQQLKELLAFLAHDLRTPLTSVQGYFELLMKSEDPERRAYFEERIGGSLIQLRVLLDEFFLLSKLQTPTMTLTLEPLSFQELISEVILTFYPEFEAQQLEPSINLPDDDSLMIQGEEEALKRVLQNLIRNALQHGVGGIVIQAGRQQDKVYFKIRNAINQTEVIHLERLFEAGYRGDPVRKARESSGLGLAIAEGLLQRMDIGIDVELQADYIEFSLNASAYNPKNTMAKPK